MMYHEAQLMKLKAHVHEEIFKKIDTEIQQKIENTFLKNTNLIADLIKCCNNECKDSDRRSENA